MLCVGLADKYGVPVSFLQRHWSSREIIELVALSQIRDKQQKKQAAAAAKPAKPKQQTPEEMLKALDSI